MKICIYGAGAIGGYIAAQLAMTDAVEITCIARGPHLKAIRSRGLTLIKDGEEKVFQIKCVENPDELGPQDYVIITLKAHSAALISDKLPRKEPMGVLKAEVITISSLFIIIFFIYFYINIMN